MTQKIPIVHLIPAIAFIISAAAAAGPPKPPRVDDDPMYRSLDLPADNALSSEYGKSDEKFSSIYDRDYYDYDPKVHKLVKTVEAYHLNQGIGKLQAGHYEFAFGDFKFMLHYYPNHPRALELAGQTALLLHQKETADALFKRAIRLFPHSPRAGKAITYKEYGKFLYEAKEYDKAIAALKQSLALDDISSEANYYLGLSYYAKKDYKHANDHAQVAYADGFPLTELREKLTAVNAWKPAAASEQANTR